MKEQIYTIPVNEAFDESDGCPFCSLYLKLEKDRCDYTLGASMMEPDARILTNSLGFCKKHFDMLLQMPNKLSFALVLDTHMQEVRKKHDLNKTAVESCRKKSFFSKKETPAGDVLASSLSEIENSCYICSQIESIMARYVEVFFYMYENDKAFKEKFDKAPYFCIRHYRELVISAKKYLSSDKYTEFIKNIFEKQKKAFETLNDDIHKFTLKFDYRNRDMPWGSAKDAPKRCTYVLGSKMRAEDENEKENN